MNNKVLITVNILNLDETYDIFIPVNELVWKIKKLIIKSIKDISNDELNEDDEYTLINKINSKIYNNNELIINTDIRNGTELLLIKY